MDEFGDHPALTDFTEGATRLSNVLFLATTNYINDVSDRLKNRPGRFDVVKRIGFPSLESRKAYVAHILKVEETDSRVQEYAEDCGEVSMAAVKEYVIQQEIFSKVGPLLESDVISSDESEEGENISAALDLLRRRVTQV